MNILPHAIILAVDTPSAGWYRGRTVFGETVDGVRLRGVNTKFAAGQKVAVFQCGNEFGFSEHGSYQSQLKIPDQHRSAMGIAAPANVALARVATLANNKRVVYTPGTVNAVIDAGHLVVNGQRFACAINALSFYAGARCLIGVGKPSKVLGWWQSIPLAERPEWWTDADEIWWNAGWWGETLRRDLWHVIMIGRIPFTADFDIQLFNSDFEVIKFNRFNHRDPGSNFCFITAYQTTPEEEFYYIKASMGVLYGAILERYWLKINKETFAVTEMLESEFPEDPGLAYSVTSNGLIWQHSGDWARVSNDGGTTWVDAFYTGPNNGDYFFPVHKWHYRTDIFPEA